MPSNVGPFPPGFPHYIVSNNERYVLSLYSDLLGRNGDPVGESALTALLDSGQITRLQAAQMIEGSQEFQRHQAQVTFQTFLRRSAEPAVEDAAARFFRAGGTIEQFKAIVLGSPEYFATQGTSTNDGFVTALYRDVLGRPVDAPSQSMLRSLLAGGASRTAIAQAVVQSPEAEALLVQGYYRAYLGRAANAVGLSALTDAFQNGARNEQVALVLVVSDEYFIRAAGRF